MQRPARPPGVPPRKPCAFFMKTGQCRYGDKCRFSHERPDAAPNGMANENSTNSKKQGQRICTTFQRTGSCKFGNKCHFLHERGPQTETTDKSSSSTADPAGIFQYVGLLLISCLFWTGEDVVLRLGCLLEEKWRIVRRNKSLSLSVSVLSALRSQVMAQKRRF